MFVADTGPVYNKEMGGGPVLPKLAISQSEVSPTVKLREFFPETWLWQIGTRSFMVLFLLSISFALTVPLLSHYSIGRLCTHL